MALDSFRPLEGPVAVVRHARLTDLPSIVEIERTSFLEPWEPDTIRQSIEWFPFTCFVATIGEKVVGFLIATPQNADDGFYGHICNLAVAPEYRNSGIGTLLLRRTEQQFALDGAEGIQLEVRESNLAARQFYRNRGYEEMMIFTRYYSNGESAIIMMKWFGV
ncbi:MAG: ribosomal protein S18-alanine N-acetyltransferase [Methanomicrobiales archaeon]|nr:ribosomal protein S18-alanine N-acetyltransferase [Methanomicrobiales archaeon]